MRIEFYFDPLEFLEDALRPANRPGHVNRNLQNESLMYDSLFYD